MKKINLKKLKLQKNSASVLNAEELIKVVGGNTPVEENDGTILLCPSWSSPKCQSTIYWCQPSPSTACPSQSINTNCNPSGVNCA